MIGTRRLADAELRAEESRTDFRDELLSRISGAATDRTRGYVPPPPPTFGSLREYGLGFLVNMQTMRSLRAGVIQGQPLPRAEPAGRVAA